MKQRKLVLCKENVRDLPFALRRSKGGSTTEAIMFKFASSCKKIKKEAKKLVMALRKLDQETTEGSSVFLDEDQDTQDMIKTLREANAMRISIFKMLLSLFFDPIMNPKQSKWSLVSRLVNKGRISCDGQDEKMNFEVGVESFESQLDDFENGLEGLFRCIVRSRSSLLNIFSC
ncbi:hypothetical protein BC332_10455 [Capsicum chinense]|nr:hypothetical protein BC332_10455 [Capsicum chinense]